MPLFREKPITHSPPTNKRGEVPQPRLISVAGEHDRVGGRTQQAPPSKATGTRIRYTCQYLEKNNISNIADMRKLQWPEFTVIDLSKNMITKVAIN